MSKTRVAGSSVGSITVQLDNYFAGHVTTPQYGMRYPDGTITWDKDIAEDAAGISAVYFKELLEATRNGATQHRVVLDWKRLVERRARVANLDPEWYADQHQLVARDVNIFTTEPHDVVR